MSNKSEATWHPNGGPEVPHADLIAKTIHDIIEDGSWSGADELEVLLIAALGDAVRHEAVAWDQGYQAGFERGVLIQAKQASGEAPANPYRAAAIREEAK